MMQCRLCVAQVPAMRAIAQIQKRRIMLQRPRMSQSQDDELAGICNVRLRAMVHKHQKKQENMGK
jgi:hypothetical protein